MLSSVKQKIKDKEAKYSFLIRQGEKISDNLSMCRHQKNAIMYPSGQRFQVTANWKQNMFFLVTLSLSHLLFCCE